MQSDQAELQTLQKEKEQLLEEVSKLNQKSLHLLLLILSKNFIISDLLLIKKEIMISLLLQIVKLPS